MKAKLIFTPKEAKLSDLEGEIFKGKDKQWYFRIKAANGEPTSHSEGVKNKKDCIKTLKLYNIPIYEI